MKLYKFRGLGSKTEYNRILKSLKTGKFYCPTFSELNDPMEGVFLVNNEDNIKNIYSKKNECGIFSMSSIWGLKKHLLWSHYANGFKGVAIEITLNKNHYIRINDEGLIKKINYNNELVRLDGNIENILTTKNKEWKYENEYRFLIKYNKNNSDLIKEHEIGKITGVYFGLPYENTINFNDIVKDNKKLQSYYTYKNNLINEIKLLNKGIKVYEGNINNNVLNFIKI